MIPSKFDCKTGIPPMKVVLRYTTTALGEQYAFGFMTRTVPILHVDLLDMQEVKRLEVELLVLALLQLHSNCSIALATKVICQAALDQPSPVLAEIQV
jgi:hypothetical protein